jgi:hypothetical protein
LSRDRVHIGLGKSAAEVEDAYIEVDRQDVDRTLNFDSTFILRNADGEEVESDEITADRDTVEVTLPISAIKEVALAVDLISGGGATADNVKWEIKPATITLTGDSKTLAGVNTISIARIDLAEWTAPSRRRTSWSSRTTPRSPAGSRRRR